MAEDTINTNESEDIDENVDLNTDVRSVDVMSADASDAITDNAENDAIETVREEMQAEIDRLTERTRLLDQFEANPQAVLQDVAGRLGMDLVPQQNNHNGTGNQVPNSTGDRVTNTSSNGEDTKPPQVFIDNVTRGLPPEMQFMGDSIARATWIASQETLRPFQQQQEATRQQQTLRERDQIAAEMDASHPEWRQSLGSMEEWYSFVREAVNGGAMRHPKFGSLQEALFKLSTGDRTAVTSAASRMRDASQNATSTSSNQTPQSVDVAKQIREARNSNDKFEIAFKAAMAQHGRL